MKQDWEGAKLCKFLKSLYRDKDLNDASYELYISVYTLTQYLNGKNFIPYDRLLSMVEYTGESQVALNTFLKSDPYLYFTYWDNINPEYPSREHIGLVLKTKRIESGETIGEIAKKSGINGSNISGYETGKHRITYQFFKRYCTTLNLNELQTLEELKNVDEIIEYRKLFSEKIISARKDINMTQEELAEAVLVKPQKIKQIEQVENLVSVDTLKTLCLVLGLNQDKMIEYGNKGMLFKAFKGDESQYAPSISSMRNLESELLEQYNQINIRSKRIQQYEIPANLYFPCLLMALYEATHNNNVISNEMMLIFGALKHKKDMIKTYREAFLNKEEVNTLENISIEDYLRARFRKMTLSAETIGSFVNIPLSKLRVIPNRDSRMTVEDMLLLSNAILFPSCVSIEKKFLEKEPESEYEKVYLYIEDLFLKWEKSGVKFQIFGKPIKIDRIHEISDIIFNRTESPKNKYLRIKKQL